VFIHFLLLLLRKMDIEVNLELLPNLESAQWTFSYSLPNELVSNKEEIKKKLLDAVDTHKMAPFYKYLCEELKWPFDKTLFEKYKSENDAKIHELDEKLKDAVQNLGESEVREIMLAKADCYARIGDKENAVSQYRLTFEKTIGSGQKLDIVFTLIRVGLFYRDHDLITRNIEKAKSMVEAGSDWDRRNRLKVYEGVYSMSVRSFKKSASLFFGVSFDFQFA